MVVCVCVFGALLSPRCRLCCCAKQELSLTVGVSGYFRLATAKKNLNELDAAADVIKVGDVKVLQLFFGEKMWWSVLLYVRVAV